jgi:hypothetical protein
MPQTLRALAVISVYAATGVGAVAVLAAFTRAEMPWAAWVAFAAVIATGASATWYWWDRPGELRRRWRERGQCVGCGYDLRGNVSGICPECGSGRVCASCKYGIRETAGRCPECGATP